MSDHPDVKVVIVGGTEEDEKDNYQQLKSLLEQIINLQEELVHGFPDKPEPELAAKYNRLREKVNHLIGDRHFVENVPEARRYNPWPVVVLYVFIWLLLSSIMGQWADQVTASVLGSVLQVTRWLLDLAAFLVLLVFVYGYYADPGKFKAFLYSRNSELRGMAQTLYKFAWDALSSLPSPKGGMTERERVLSEEVLRLRMEVATMQGLGNDVLAELRQAFFGITSLGSLHLDERDTLLRIREQYIANLWRKQEQRAMYGINVPTEIENEIAFIEEQIADIDGRLSRL